MRKDRGMSPGVPRRSLGQLVRRDWQLMLIFLPVFLFYIIFSYLPMVGILMAFKDDLDVDAMNTIMQSIGAAS